ncbi:MAG: bifunctional 5,10-methylene-tetrahydrofolate dehydrogenase/5,10-methylene-tetrahydrofolate cyclohydrolase [Lentisphaeria bacterium]|nr:bifunctional 5,10-methylene-tetrahydrofolate dehydrogenase/5,10-methylene-tetrahydrofolate cyclohydrolase [Lentisphaeria bacterium]
MSAIIIDGKAIAAKVNAETAAETEKLVREKGVRPGLAVILAGEDPASQVYVSRKVKMCGELGIDSRKILLPADVSQDTLLGIIRDLNNDPAIHGILVQSPAPKQISEQAVVRAIDPRKDVDCFHPENVGKVFLGDLSGFLPCTPWGISVLLAESGISTAGKHAVILGRSAIVGRPMAALLLAKGAGGDATVTICHSRTKDLASFTRQADIVIAALGIPRFLKADMIREGAVVVDVGINRIPAPETKTGSRLVGDVDYEPVAEKAGAITPVPGGVGPMTIAMLMKNTLRAVRMAEQD